MSDKEAVYKGENMVSCNDFRYLQSLDLDCKNILIFSEDNSLDFKSIKNIQNNNKVHSSDPVEITIMHKTGTIVCCVRFHGNIKLGSKSFYTNFLEIPFKTPDILSLNTAASVSKFFNVCRLQ